MKNQKQKQTNQISNVTGMTLVLQCLWHLSSEVPDVDQWELGGKASCGSVRLLVTLRAEQDSEIKRDDDQEEADN